jgi:uncharacterized RDD family membrane protein YckC
MTSALQTRSPETLLGHYAGLSSRLVAFILDTAIVSGIIISTSWFIATSWRLLQLAPLLTQIEQKSPILENLVAFVTSPIVYSLFTLLFVATYYIFFWITAGQTPGKGVMGLRVLPRQGGKLKLSHAIVRYIGYYLSIIPFGLGIFWILIDDRRLAWHDKLAGTCVVYAWEAKPDETFLAVETSKLIASTQAVRAYLDKKRKSG